MSNPRRPARFGKTTTMDTNRVDEPVIAEIPRRGRDMITRDIVAVAGEPDSNKGGEMFHQGYVEDKKYLVPDSTLRAMADIVNLKMRKSELPRNKTIKKHDKTDGLKWWDDRRVSMMKKLDEMDLSGEEEEEKAEEEEKVEEEEKEEEEEEKEEEEEELEEEEKIEEEEEEEEEEVEEEEKLEEEEKVEEEEVKEEESEDEESTKVEEEETESEVGEEEEEIIPIEEVKTDDTIIYPGKYYDPEVKRFLISGHFRTNRKPIYIIHQYAGPSVFSSKDPQFYSHKSEKDADVFIAGEFYKESILEEDDSGRPRMLNTKPRRIAVDDASRIYENEFNDTFVGKDLDVELSGGFIRHAASSVFTPLLTIALRAGSAKATTGFGSKRTTPVYLSRPLASNIFQSWRKPSSSPKKNCVRFSSDVGVAPEKRPRKARSKSSRNTKKAGPHGVDSSEVTVLLPRSRVTAGRSRSNSQTTSAGHIGSKSSRRTKKAGPDGVDSSDVTVLLHRPGATTGRSRSNSPRAGHLGDQSDVAVMLAQCGTILATPFGGEKEVSRTECENSNARAPRRRGQEGEPRASTGRRRMGKRQAATNTEAKRGETGEDTPIRVDVTWEVQRDKKESAKKILARLFHK